MQALRLHTVCEGVSNSRPSSDGNTTLKQTNLHAYQYDNRSSWLITASAQGFNQFKKKASCEKNSHLLSKIHITLNRMMQNVLCIESFETYSLLKKA